MAWLHDRPRRLALRLHRWLGLGLAPLAVLLGLTGSLLVYYVEIDRALEPAFDAALPAPRVSSWQAVLDTLERAHPHRDRGWRIELPPDGVGLVTARYLKPAESEGAFFAPLLVTVDPSSGQVLASRLWGRYAATWVYDLHYTLLAGEGGRQLVGWIGFGLALSLASGLALWWPRRRQWRAALRLKLDGSAARRHYDLHKLAGIVGGAVLLVIALTGVALAWPPTTTELLRPLGLSGALPAVQRARDAERALLPLDTLLGCLQQQLPDAVPRWVDTPPAGSAVFRVRLWQPGDPSRRFPHGYAWLDGHDGSLLAQRRAAESPLGNALLAWVHPLHNGEAFGAAGRVIACMAGLLPLLLALTGWLRWRDRRRAQAAASDRSCDAGTLRARDAGAGPLHTISLEEPR